jgi:hypothetical protein
MLTCCHGYHLACQSSLVRWCRPDDRRHSIEFALRPVRCPAAFHLPVHRHAGRRGRPARDCLHPLRWRPQNPPRGVPEEPFARRHTRNGRCCSHRRRRRLGSELAPWHIPHRRVFGGRNRKLNRRGRGILPAAHRWLAAETAYRRNPGNRIRYQRSGQRVPHDTAGPASFGC